VAASSQDRGVDRGKWQFRINSVGKRPLAGPAFLICGYHTGTQDLAVAETVGEQTMKGVKGAIVITAVIAAVALGACRREVPHEPMKLGADVPVAGQAAR